MDCVLHIGLEKTGTTAIQHFMSSNRERLAARGILYPSTPGRAGHRALAAYAREDDRFDDVRVALGLNTPAAVADFRHRFRRELTAEVSSGRGSLCVLSSEHCSSRLLTSTEVDRLHELLRPLFGRVTVVVYLRRQDDFLLSTYSNAVKRGETRRCALPDDDKVAARYSYDRLLDRWAGPFGIESLVCRRYDRGRLRNGDVVEDFAELVGIDPNDGYRRPPVRNESLDARTLEYLRMLNAQRLFTSTGRIDKRRLRLIRALQVIADGPQVTLPHEQLARFMAAVAPANARVAKKYFGEEPSGAGDPLFGPAEEPSSGRAEMRDLTTAEVIEITAALLGSWVGAS